MKGWVLTGKTHRQSGGVMDRFAQSEEINQSIGVHSSKLLQTPIELKATGQIENLVDLVMKKIPLPGRKTQIRLRQIGDKMGGVERPAGETEYVVRVSKKW